MTETVSILDALHHWPFAVWLRSSGVAYPLLEFAHIVGLATVFGSLLIVDMRLLGFLKTLDAAAVARNVLPWSLGGFGLAAATGSLMFIARSSDLVANRMFLIKVVLLLVAAINAAVLHSRGPVNATHIVTKAQAGLSLLIWIGVIFCGRWIAYV